MNAQSAFKPMGNADAEAALLGSLMLNAKLIDSTADVVCADDFSDPLFARIFQAVIHEHSLGRAANPVTLKHYFENDEAMTELGGAMAFLGGLTGSGANTVGAKGFAAQIKSIARRRRLMESLHGVIANSEAFETTIEELVDEADAALVAATDSGEGIHQPTAAECIGEVLEGFGKANTGVNCVSIPTMDRLLGPAKPKQLIILAARPGMGKTACALSYAIGAARGGHGVLFISLEMSSTELGARMAADICFDGQGGVPFSAINGGGDISRDNLRRVKQAQEEAADLPLRIIDVGSITIGRVGMMVRRHARRMAAAGQKLELVVVDYLQLVRPDHRASAYEAVSEVSRGLKAIAKTHGVAIMALAQLSREVEKRPDKMPQLSDLRDSGQIEQDADAVMFLMRPEYYLNKDEPQPRDPERGKWESAMSEARGVIEFICAKRRNGPDGKGQGQFFGQFQAVRG